MDPNFPAPASDNTAINVIETANYVILLSQKHRRSGSNCHHLPLAQTLPSQSSKPSQLAIISMGLLPDMQNCGLRMHRDCRERFPRHRLQRKPLVSDPDMHHGTCMSGSLTRGGGENVPDIPGACATRNFAYLVRGPWPRNISVVKLQVP